MFREEFEDYFKTCVVEDRETWMDDLQKLGDVVGKMEWFIGAVIIFIYVHYAVFDIFRLRCLSG